MAEMSGAMENAEASATLLLERADARLQEREIAGAIGCFDKAEAAGADRDRCAGGRWLGRMLRGDLEGAWRESDAIRARGTDDPHRFWNGEALLGRRVIVRCLHGYGDAVQMLRYVPKLKAMCAELIVEVPPRLVALAKCLAGVGWIITWGEEAPVQLPDWDVQVEVMELPYLFRTSAAELPVATGYLRLPSSMKAEMAAMMGPRERLRIGVVWAAGEWNPARSFPFELVQQLTAETTYEFWNLQGGAARADGRGMLCEAEECGEEIIALAGMIQAVDLVITVDTLAAHLAGAMGKEAWVLLQYAADWRWQTEREDSPWYPTLRLYRQSSQGDWAGVAERVRQDLACGAGVGLVDDPGKRSI